MTRVGTFLRNHVRAAVRIGLSLSISVLGLAVAVPQALAAPSVGPGGTINIGPSTSVAINQLLPAANAIQAQNYGNETITAIVTATTGTVQLTTSTGLSTMTGYQTNVTDAAASIAFYGTATNVNSALNTMKYNAGASAGTDSISISISDHGPGNMNYDPTSGFYFQYVSNTITWDAAFNAITGDTLTNALSPASVAKRQAQTASSGCAYTFNGMCGYFAMALNSSQNAFITNKVGTAQTWLGASDRYYEGRWVWSDPKAPGYNKQFSDQSSTMSARVDQTGSSHAGTGSNSTGQPVSYSIGGSNYSFVQWNSNEPNNSGGSENALQIVSGGTGNWNDLPEDSSQLGYIVEYGGLGETLAYPSSSATVSVNIGYIPTIYLGVNGGSNTVTYRSATGLTATINPAGKVTFLANGKPIPGCRNVAATTTASCPNWKPANHGYFYITAQIVPTNGSYPSKTTPGILLFSVARGNTR